jgi:hypothetical protein
MERQLFDVIVIGGGNAALCAALAAVEQGAKVALLERAPETKRGGNSNFTGGGFRMVHHGAQDIKRVVPDLSDEEIARTEFGEYSAEDYLDDLGRITQYYIDPDLAETLLLIRNFPSVDVCRDPHLDQGCILPHHIPPTVVFQVVGLLPMPDQDHVGLVDLEARIDGEH